MNPARLSVLAAPAKRGAYSGGLIEPVRTAQRGRLPARTAGTAAKLPAGSGHRDRP